MLKYFVTRRRTQEYPCIARTTTQSQNILAAELFRFSSRLTIHGRSLNLISLLRRKLSCGKEIMKKITVITGHYGSGKTNLAVNLAVKAAEEGKKVTVADLDIVNPYFRTADFKELFDEKGITLAAPDFANSNLDIPSIQFDVEELAAVSDCLIIDVGGDDAGAFALGRYAEALLSYGSETELYYVINQRRYLTQTPDEVLGLMYEIEAAARMKHTAIVNNTNLGSETTLEIVEASEEFAAETAERAGLPLAFTTCPEELAEFSENENIFPIKVYVKPLWEK